MLAETAGPFVMTNAMLAKTDRQAEPLKFLDNLRCDSLDLYVALDTIIIVGILGVKQICFLIGEIGYRLEQRFSSVYKDNRIVTVPASVLFSHDNEVAIVNTDARHRVTLRGENEKLSVTDKRGGERNDLCFFNVRFTWQPAGHSRVVSNRRRGFKHIAREVRADAATTVILDLSVFLHIGKVSLHRSLGV